MNNRFFSTIFFLFVFICAAGTASASDKAPDFSLPKMDGSKVSLSQLKGQVVYVDFWATWCPPCRESFPWMESMYDRYKDFGFEIVAISLDQKPDLVKNFLKSHPASFTILQDVDGGSAENFKVKGMPSSYLVDRKGNIRVRHAGFNDGDKAGLEAEIKKLIRE